LFVDFRWADNGGKPYCPRCGCLEPYSVRRRRFRCSEPECRAEFSVTSGTVFANRKLSFKKIVMAIWEEITAAKGMAALHLSRKLNVQYKTAYVLLQKLREAVGLRRSAVTLQGLVQIDGKYVGGVLRNPLRRIRSNSCNHLWCIARRCICKYRQRSTSVLRNTDNCRYGECNL
jgi:hypothetical protein